jgi:hypothetical protein
MTEPPHTPDVRQRLVHEVRSYALTAAYLYVCFGALLIYKASVQAEAAIHFSAYGFALVKALVLAKFLMLGEALKAGTRQEGESLPRGVLRGSLRLLLIIFVLNVVEELAAGAIHRRHPAQVLAEHVDGGRWAEFLATCLLLWLILMPYLALKHIAQLLGPEGFRRVWRGQR